MTFNSLGEQLLSFIIVKYFSVFKTVQQNNTQTNLVWKTVTAEWKKKFSVFKNELMGNSSFGYQLYLSFITTNDPQFLELKKQFSWVSSTLPSRTRYLWDIYRSFCCLFFVGILQISFKYIQKHHPFIISIKHLENIFIKTFYVRYLNC